MTFQMMNLSKIKKAWNFFRAFFLVGLVFSLSGCFKDSKKEQAWTPEQKVLHSKGKGIYFSVCIACHNANPKLPGAVGPDIYGSSLELLEHRVILGKYPEGYKPKRKGQEMPVFEDLKKDIPALHFFLNN